MVVELESSSQCRDFNGRALSKEDAKCRLEYVFTRLSLQYSTAIRSGDGFTYL